MYSDSQIDHMATTPDPVNRFSHPASVEEFQTWFDADGRLVKESLMRQCLFEGKTACIGVSIITQCAHTTMVVVNTV